MEYLGEFIQSYKYFFNDKIFHDNYGKKIICEYDTYNILYYDIINIF
jgi:hypothetical protein